MGMRILIVDDSNITRMVLRKTISMIEMEVEEIYEAGNGEEALVILEDHDVDMIFADLNMPGMNGMEMTSEIFSSGKEYIPPIIVISSEASHSRLQELQREGVSAYVHKPFTPEAIRDAITIALDHSHI